MRIQQLVLLPLLLFGFVAVSRAEDGNRLTYLDEFLDPYYVNHDFPKLTTPQWVGEPGVEAVVVLAIDDMRDSAHYEAYLRPILDRLKQIDGRAALSIMTNRADPQDLQIQTWLREGVSIDVHTYDHPCPCLQGGNFPAARQTYEQCVDLMASIPGNRPVAFRMPCCDSMNTPSPRFWAEVFNRTTGAGNYLTIDSSVFQLFTPADPELPREEVLLEDGSERFRRYVPFPSFVNIIHDYPYPYVIGRLCWEFPCMVPSDWEAQHVQQPNNPRTVEDLNRAIDLTVLKQGVFDLVFHPHGWIRNDQVVEMIDHAVQKHGGRLKFLNFREAQERIDEHLLGGQPLRDASGQDNGVRLLDLNADGYLDVVIGNEQLRQTRIWSPEENRWITSNFPAAIVSTQENKRSIAARFGMLSGQVVLLVATEQQRGAWRWDGQQWTADERLLAGLEYDGDPLHTSQAGRDRGLRLRDLDEDGSCELLVSNAEQNAVFRWDAAEASWQRLPFGLPSEARIVDAAGRDAGVRLVDLDQDGRDDVLFSDERGYGAYLFVDLNAGWSKELTSGQRPAANLVPMIVRQGTNNGAWFHSGHLWVQNEDTDRLPDKVDRLKIDDLFQQPQPAADAQSAADSFPPAKDPEQSLATISVREGLVVQLVAAEPLVEDPVAFDWGPDGRLWVVEMRDYPLGLDGQGQPGGRVKVLTDTNRDGVYDTSAIFLDQLPFPTGIKVWRNGVLVTAAPELLYAEDTDGDDRADVRRTLFAGFREGNQQHRVNGLRWGLDNWVYLANGDSGGSVKSLLTEAEVEISGRDVRIRPDEGAIDTTSGQTQFGRDRDDWGNWFGGNNSEPIWHYVLDERYLRRNPHLRPTVSLRRQISEQPGAAPVYPTSRTLPRFNDFDRANRFTSACSPTIYRDVLLGPEYAGDAFICEPVHNLVHREDMQPEGISFHSRRAAGEELSEFLRSSDNWFRPTMVRTGPDGAVWIADMYRLVIEHPEWIPREWQERLDLRDGSNRGRIYRVYAQSAPPRPLPRLDELDTAGLVRALESPSGWQRDMAQQMLIWQADPQAADLLIEQLQKSEQPLARLHALCTLDGLGQLRPELIERALEDSHAGVRRHAIRLAEQFAETPGNFLDRLAGCVDDEDPQVRLQLAFTLGAFSEPAAAELLAELLVRAEGDAYLVTAALSSVSQSNLPQVAAHLLNRTATPQAELLEPLTSLAASMQHQDSLRQLLRCYLALPAETRLPQIAQLIERLPSAAAQWIGVLEGAQRDQWQRLQQEALAQSRNAEEELAVRQAALRVVGLAGREEAQYLEAVAEQLHPRNPPELQLVAIDVLGAIGSQAAAELLLEQWSRYSPAARLAVLDEVLERPQWTAALLDRIETEQVLPSQISARHVQQLREHSDRALGQRAERLLQLADGAARHSVVDAYLSQITGPGNAKEGKLLFAKHCGSCHRLEGEGQAVGPDLAALGDKSPQNLLVAVLDPNRAVEDKYLSYVAITADGRQLSGILSEETASTVTLIAADGKPLVLARQEIEDIRSTGKSLMPEGIERELPPQQLADIVAFVRSADLPPKSFPGNEPQLAPVRDDGSIRLMAIHARIYGPSLVFEQTYRNLGYWCSAEDRAVWTLRAPKAGRYRVSLDYACPHEFAGNELVIQSAGQTLHGQVQATGSWDQYGSQTVGTLELPEGELELALSATSSLRGCLLDLRTIILSPVD